MPLILQRINIIVCGDLMSDIHCINVHVANYHYYGYSDVFILYIQLQNQPSLLVCFKGKFTEGSPANNAKYV